VRLRIITAICVPMLFATPSLRAEYVSLKNGNRLHVTSYELIGDKYRLKLSGGTVEVLVEDVASIDPEERFAAIPAPPAPAAAAAAEAFPFPYGELVKAAAARYAVDEQLIYSVIAAESNFDPKAISKRNARGLMQLLPETAARFGVQDIFDPKQNIEAGTHYLSDLLKRYNNDLVLALAAYNAGPERVEQYGRVPPYSETVAYVRRVKGKYEKNKSAAQKAGTAPNTAQTVKVAAPAQSLTPPTPPQQASNPD